MALIKGLNSYVTVAESDSYFANRIDVAAWEVASDVQKEQARVTATTILETVLWCGVVVDDSQALAFPRNGYYFDPRLGKQVSLSDLGTPNRVLQACMETAYHLLNNDGLMDETGTVLDMQVSGVSMTKIRNPSKMPGIARTLIQPLLSSNARNWWRAN
jgi:hypothetical protein